MYTRLYLFGLSIAYFMHVTWPSSSVGGDSILAGTLAVATLFHLIFART